MLFYYLSERLETGVALSVKLWSTRYHYYVATQCIRALTLTYGYKLGLTILVNLF